MHRGSDFNNTIGDFVEAIKQVGIVESLVAASGSNNELREGLSITNLSNKIIFIGKSGVAISGANQGEMVYPGDTLYFNYNKDVQLYAISGFPNLDVKIVEYLSK